MATLEEVRAAKTLAHEIFSDLVGVAAVGITQLDGTYVLRIALTEEPTVDLPTDVNGIPVVVKVVGTIHPQGSAHG